MKRKHYPWIGLVVFLLLVLLGPLLAFPSLQMKLDQEIQGLESYKMIPRKSLDWHGRNAYLSVPDGMDTALIVNAMNDMKAVKGVRGVDLSYGTQFAEVQEEAKPVTESTSEEVASTPETEPTTEVESIEAEATTETETTTASDEEAILKVQEVMDELLSFSAIEFDYGTAELTEGSKESAEKIAELLNKYPEIMLKITGHTDSVGTEKNNKVMSLLRAQAVVDELMIRGIELDRLTAEGKGEAEPIASNDTEDGRKLNRRVELTGLEN